MQNLGCGLMKANKHYSSKFLDFRSILPDSVLFTRNDTSLCATYRDLTGKLRLTPANIPRFDHSLDGYPLGILIEGARTNKLNLLNAAPVSITGFAVTSGLANINLVNDKIQLDEVGLGQIGNGNVIRINNLAQNTESVISISTLFGNANAHSFSLWARLPQGNATLSRSGAGVQSISMNAQSYTRYKLENITGHAAADCVQIKISPGGDLYIILYQLEEGIFSSSEIVVSGVPATRGLDRVRIAGLSSLAWWNSQEGYISASYRSYAFNSGVSDQVIAQAHDGTVNNCIGMKINRSAEKDFVLNIRSGGVLNIPGASLCPHVRNANHRASMSWKDDKIISMQGGIVKTAIPSIAFPSNLTEFSIGARNGGSDPLWGWIEFIEIGKKYREKSPCLPSDVLVFGAGQSLMKGLFHSQESSSKAGHDVFCETAAIYDTSSQCIFADGSTGGTAASKTSDATKYWWDKAAGKRGPIFEDFYNYIKEAGFVPNIILWSQGEADSHFIGNSTSPETYKNCLENIFGDMRETLGDIQIFIQPIGRRSAASGYANIGAIQKIRDIQKEICLENAEWCRLSAESYDQLLYDDVHLSDAGYQVMARRHAAVIAGRKVLGPEIISASRNGVVVTVNLVHGDLGDDFMPQNNISGFYFTSNGESIDISEAARLATDKVEIILQHEPVTGNEILYYGYDGMKDINPENILRDNSPHSMPLKTARVLL